ncbi:MAG: 4Fe-4S binding protein [Candidatus Riflebacteria bacterium]|nr:4Fe-4S binding protein [Candidatus Riflebacteria bacterium]
MIKRLWVQLTSSLIINANLKGFFTGGIYKGNGKYICVPVLNCYSCPGALGSCPVGAAQAVIASSGGLDPTAVHTWGERFKAIISGTPLYVIGLLAIVGSLIGRATCGWCCPFGFLQDLLNRIRSPKAVAPKFLRYGKYLFLIVTVIILPLFLVDQFGGGEPTFCKFICPAGTLQGGILLPLLNANLRAMLGKLFAWKMFVLVIILTLAIIFRRPFCRWICPLGAFLGPLNRVSCVRLSASDEGCVHCGACDRVCPTELSVLKEIDSPDCIRCLECVRVCPVNVIRIHDPSGLIPKFHAKNETSSPNQEKQLL